jgi:hypothetical protein
MTTDIVYIAMPRYGSGARFPTGVFEKEEDAYEAQNNASSPAVYNMPFNELSRYGKVMEGLDDDTQA